LYLGARGDPRLGSTDLDHNLATVCQPRSDYPCEVTRPEQLRLRRATQMQLAPRGQARRISHGKLERHLLIVTAPLPFGALGRQ
jgi:hypothetical protein